MPGWEGQILDHDICEKASNSYTTGGDQWITLNTCQFCSSKLWREEDSASGSDLFSRLGASLCRAAEVIERKFQLQAGCFKIDIPLQGEC